MRPAIATASELPQRPATEEVRALIEGGLFLRAFRRAEREAPLARWEGASQRVLASRIADHLGAPRLSRICLLKALRSRVDRSDPEVRFYQALEAATTSGPLAALDLLRRGSGEQATTRIRSNWRILEASCFVQLKQFADAEGCFATAEAELPDNPWLWVQRAQSMLAQDRNVEALPLARAALELSRETRAGLAFVARLHQRLGDPEAAIALLEEGVPRLESASLCRQLASYLVDAGRPREAILQLDRALELSPLLERGPFQSVAAQLSHAHYLAGEVDRSCELLELAGEERFAARVRGGAGRRTLLAVPFTLQHEMTCAPATLSSLTGYFHRRAEHLAIAQEICHDGTPPHVQRQWAERNGWVVREFSMTWEVATALIDRDLPFAFSTLQADSAHLQALAGYDARRRSLLVRDPSEPLLVELDAEKLFEAHAPHGPHATLLLPPAEVSRLEGLLLPDAEVWDLAHRVSLALEEEDREAAVAACDALVTLAPGHVATLQARRQLASLDGGPVERVRLLEAQREVQPTSKRLSFELAYARRELIGQEEAVGKLRELVSEEKGEVVFHQALAEELLGDARTVPEARRLLATVLTRRPQHPPAYWALGRIAASEGERERAAFLFRIAAALNDKNEGFACAWFDAAWRANDSGRALEWLEARQARYGERTAEATLSLARAYCQLDHPERALELLERAGARRPGDPVVAARRVEARLEARDLVGAAELLAAFPRAASLVTRKRLEAMLASARGELARAAELWGEVLELNPLHGQARAERAWLVAATRGLAEAVTELRDAAESFPHCGELQQLAFGWLSRMDRAAGVAILDRMLASSPANAWALRERAVSLVRQGRGAAGLEDAQRAVAVEPRSPYSHSVLAHVLRALDRGEESRAAARRSVEAWADADPSWAILLGDQPSAERRAALELIQAELARQRPAGLQILPQLCDELRAELGPAAALELARARHAERPELFGTWHTLIDQLLQSDGVEEAFGLAQQAVTRFPRIPVLRLDLAAALERKERAAEAIDSNREAVRLAPGWLRAASALHRRLVAAGEPDAALEVVRQQVAHEPLAHEGWVALARALHPADPEKSWEALARAVAFAPDRAQAWEALLDFAFVRGRAKDALALAREAAARYPAMVAPCVAEVKALERLGDPAGALEALERVIARDPADPDHFDLKATLLANQGRVEEAEAATRPAVFGDRPPHLLLGRAAALRWDRGDRQGAIEAMSAVVGRHPGYAWGLVQLADWTLEVGDADASREWANKLIDLGPDRPRGQACLGAALRKLGDPRGATAAFHKAFERDPSFLFAGWNLFELLLEAKDPEQAGAILQKLEPELSPGWLRAGRVALHLHRAEWKPAAEELESLCLEGSYDGDAARYAARLFGRFEKSGRLRRALQRASRRPGCAEAAGQLWLQVRYPVALYPVWLALWTLPPGAFRERASIDYLEALGGGGRAFAARWFVRLFGRRLRTPDAVWGTVAYALVATEQTRRALRWLSDWRTRGRALPWMLLNVVVAATSCRRIAEARAALAAALALPADHSRRQLETLAAFFAAVDDRPEEARAALARAGGAPLTATYEMLKELTELLAATAGRTLGFTELHRVLMRCHALTASFQQREFPLSLKLLAIAALGRGRGPYGALWRVLWTPYRGLLAALIGIVLLGSWFAALWAGNR